MDIQGVGQVFQWNIGSCLQEALELLALAYQIGAGFALQNAYLSVPVQVVALGCCFVGQWVLLQDCVGVDPPEAESVHASPPGGLGRTMNPRAGLGVDVEGGLIQLQRGTGLIHVQGGGQDLVIERQSCLDQPSDPGGRHGVADHGLNGAQRAPLVDCGFRIADFGFVIPRSEDAGQGLNLGSIAHESRRPMSLDEADGAR